MKVYELIPGTVQGQSALSGQLASVGRHQRLLLPLCQYDGKAEQELYAD